MNIPAAIMSCDPQLAPIYPIPSAPLDGKGFYTMTSNQCVGPGILVERCIAWLE